MEIEGTRQRGCPDGIVSWGIWRVLYNMLLVYYPSPVGGRGIVFGRFLSLFPCQQHYEKTAGPICMKFSGKVWSDHGTTWLNFGSIRVNGSAGQGSICLLSPAIAQRTSVVNKSVSFARWQQGAGFVVPRTSACWISVRTQLNRNISETHLYCVSLGLHIVDYSSPLLLVITQHECSERDQWRLSFLRGGGTG